jgi:rhamnose transport system substrate-binding protein
VWWNVGNPGTLVFGTFRLYAECKIEPKTGSIYTVKDSGM